MNKMTNRNFKRNVFNHNSIFPSNPLLMCIIGSSGSGKTYLLFKMLTTPGLLDFNNLLIYTSTPNQMYYKFLKGLEYLDKRDIQILFNLYTVDPEVQQCDISQLIDEKLRSIPPGGLTIYADSPTITGITVQITDNPQDLDVNKIDSSKKNLVIFDDCVTDKNQKIQQDFFTKGRHMNCHCIYQAQSFYGLDKDFIRKNANCFIFFSLNDRNLSQIIQDVNIGISKNVFKEICQKQWDKPDEYKYVFINIRKPSLERVRNSIFS